MITRIAAIQKTLGNARLLQDRHSIAARLLHSLATKRVSNLRIAKRRRLKAPLIESNDDHFRYRWEMAQLIIPQAESSTTKGERE